MLIVSISYAQQQQYTCFVPLIMAISLIIDHPLLSCQLEEVQIREIHVRIIFDGYLIELLAIPPTFCSGSVGKEGKVITLQYCSLMVSTLLCNIPRFKIFVFS